jgi:hypothetical protein
MELFEGLTMDSPKWAPSVASLAKMEEVHLELARENPAAFCSYVLRSEERGARVSNSRNHVAWHRAINEHDRIVIWGHVESAKTQQISVGRSLWELGKNPNLRIVVVSNTDGMAKKITKLVSKYIKQSEELKKVFPDLLPDPTASWTQHMLYVKRETLAKDPSFQSCGMHGNVLGARIDLLILDDALDYESTRSEGMRQDAIQWFKTTLEGRLTPNARVWCVGMIWHEEDLMHELAANPLYHSIRSPVLDENGQSTWKMQWPIERIERKRVELGPLEFDRQMMCLYISDTESRFKREWIERCMERGEGKSLAYALMQVPDGYRVITGVDLAVSQKDSADETVLFTIAIHPDDSREVLDITSGKYHGPEIVDLIIDVQRRYQSLVVVENNAAQDFIIQFTRDRANIPVEPYTTGASVHHPEFGVEGIGAEMAASKWIIPCRRVVQETGSEILICQPEVQRWIDELIYYDPRMHTGDRLMASFFAREGSKMNLSKPKARAIHLDTISR